MLVLEYEPCRRNRLRLWPWPGVRPLRAPRITNDEDGRTARLPVGEVRAVAWSPDGTRVATALDDGTAGIRDAATGEKPASLAGHPAAVADVACSPDGTRVATAGLDGVVEVWSVG
jgi:WD40 repeat protein